MCCDARGRVLQARVQCGIHLSLAGAHLARGLSLLHISVGSNGLEHFDDRLGLLLRLELGREHERDLSDAIDRMTASHHQRRQGRSSQSGSNSETLLVCIDLAVPLAPEQK